MKKLIITTFAAACYLMANAQVDLYANQDTVTGANVTYRVTEMSSSSYYISNVTNTRIGEKMRLLDGSPAPPLYDDDYYMYLKAIGYLKAIRNAIFQEIFTSSQLKTLKAEGKMLGIDVVILPNNGSIAEVRFSFSKKSFMSSIPPDTWYALETKIKERVKFTVSPELKTRQFISGLLLWSFKTVPTD